MLDPRLVLLALCLYMGGLLLVALWAERRAARGPSPAGHPVVYSLSLGVYCTAWTYYGSVGQAANNGILFLPIYLGPTLVFLLGWTLLRKMVRLKTAHHLTSVADFIASRYDRSQLLAAIVTVVAVVGIIPYIALQLKAIVATFELITGASGRPLMGAVPESAEWPAVSTVPILGEVPWLTEHVGLIIGVLIVLFTIVLGLRRLDASERHEGMIVALAVECVVKLIGFLIVGFFVSYVLFGGLGDVFERLKESPFAAGMRAWESNPVAPWQWLSYLVLSMAAVLFLPRQYHVAVVENGDESHIRTAMWLFPLYMLLINIFVIPIAAAGLLLGYAPQQADMFVLLLPMGHGERWLSLLVFLGGFSAAFGMLMISSVAISIMVTNHLLLPLIQRVPRLEGLKGHVLQCRWAVVVLVILTGYGFAVRVGGSYMLVNIGLISFAAVFQFVPAAIGGLFWRRGNRTGALWGLSAGFLIWFYTLFLPAIVKSGWLPGSFLEHGPFGMSFLKPEALCGLGGLDPMSHSVLWGLLLNVGAYVIGSLISSESGVEEGRAEEFVSVLKGSSSFCQARERESYISLAVKRQEVEALLRQYFSANEAVTLLDSSLVDNGLAGLGRISIVQLLALHGSVERCLAGAIGSTAAHQAIISGTFFSEREARDLADVYAEMLSDLHITPSELKQQVETLQALQREKANMISMFAHDMRSSLTGIHGLGLRLLNKDSCLDREQRLDYLRVITREAGKLESLVEDFLEFSRLETGRLKLNFGATSLEKELTELHEAYQAKAAQKNLRLELMLEENLPIIEADAGRLRRVFTNLLDNAVKFSKDAGTITIAAAKANQEGVVVHVADEGIGMDPEELPYIFDLFHRGEGCGKRDGYGIGLATVKAIVDGHGGRVEVASELGKGSVFSVHLPLQAKGKKG